MATRTPEEQDGADRSAILRMMERMGARYFAQVAAGAAEEIGDTFAMGAAPYLAWMKASAAFEGAAKAIETAEREGA